MPLRPVRAALLAMSASVVLGISPADVEIPSGSPLVEINGEVVRAEDLDRALGVKLTKLYEQIYTLKREQLDAMIAQRLLNQEAAKRGDLGSCLVRR